MDAPLLMNRWGDPVVIHVAPRCHLIISGSPHGLDHHDLRGVQRFASGALDSPVGWWDELLMLVGMMLVG